MKKEQKLCKEWFLSLQNTICKTVTNIEKDFLPVFKRFYSDKKLRTCPKTGEVMEADPKYI